MGWIKAILDKWSCAHKWDAHSKKHMVRKVYVENILGDGYNPTGIKNEFTREVLMCGKCGKIKTIEY